ncbi:hypothetical protein GCM10010916_38340 [Paenibacillus abyssi]|uniref:Uncharacterized protein n=1 Tax=Paenibacillus abyssi TaxID=1340531 RepID=A0A917LFD1_9BACL|nr:hypothetical protein GCM10010916_38340 [Paenibacillus abyssi]
MKALFGLRRSGGVPARELKGFKFRGTYAIMTAYIIFSIFGWVARRHAIYRGFKKRFAKSDNSCIFCG